MAVERLICEADVLAMGAGEVLHLDSRTVATPSALDAAHQRGIRVLRGKAGGCATASGRKKKPCLWHKVLENDGTYVVQIIDGHATVSRLTDSGPVAFGTDSVQEHNR